MDTEPLHLKAERAALARLGVGEPTADHPRTFGAGIMPGMQMLAERYGFTSGEEVLAAYLPEWQAMFPDEIRPMPGAGRLLRALNERGVPCALVTSGESEYVAGVVARFGWENMFKVVISLEDVTRLKPHSEPYVKAVAALGFMAAECVGFEDSGPGIASLKGAGAYAVAVHRDVRERPELREADEQMVGLDIVGDGEIARLFGVW